MLAEEARRTVPPSPLFETERWDRRDLVELEVDGRSNFVSAELSMELDGKAGSDIIMVGARSATGRREDHPFVAWREVCDAVVSIIFDVYHFWLDSSSRYRGNAIAEITEILDRLRPEKIDHAWVLTAEVVNEMSDS
jgi:hypothetical protein